MYNDMYIKMLNQIYQNIIKVLKVKTNFMRNKPEHYFRKHLRTIKVEMEFRISIFSRGQLETDDD